MDASIRFVLFVLPEGMNEPTQSYLSELLLCPARRDFDYLLSLRRILLSLSWMKETLQGLEFLDTSAFCLFHQGPPYLPSNHTNLSQWVSFAFTNVTLAARLENVS